MIRKSLFCAYASALLLAPAFAQDLPLSSLAVHMPRAAVAAIRFRDEGKPKEFLTRALPDKGPDNNRTAQEMHQIADDVYGFPEVRGLPYFAYTQERFARELRGETAPRKFSEVSVAVFACQTSASADDWSALNSCMTANHSGNCLVEPKWHKVIQCVTKSVQDFSPTK